MGWRESRVSLLPSGWHQVSEPSSKARTFDGHPVMLLRTKRQSNGQEKGLQPKVLQKWLEDRGFRVGESWQSGVQLVQADITAELYAEDCELAEILLTFTLSPESPSRWDAWQAIVNDLCVQWGLSLGDPAHNRKVGPDELLRLLAETISWQDFQRAYNWPTVASVGK